MDLINHPSRCVKNWFAKLEDVIFCGLKVITMMSLHAANGFMILLYEEFLQSQASASKFRRRQRQGRGMMILYTSSRVLPSEMR